MVYKKRGFKEKRKQERRTDKTDRRSPRVPHKSKKLLVRVDANIAKEMKKRAVLLELPLYKAYELACIAWMVANEDELKTWLTVTGDTFDEKD